MPSEKTQTIHRTLNTILAIGVFCIGLLLINPIIESTKDLHAKYTGLDLQRIIESEIDQIADDEGYRPCAYKDSLGLRTIGFGTLIEGNNTIGCIDGHEAIELLRKHYTDATRSVEQRYTWATGKTKLVLVNLTYNMGSTRLAKFKLMLSHLKNKEYDLSAGELLNSRYARQVPNRAGRMAGRIMALKGE